MNLKPCGGCTLCCSGTLTVTINEHKVSPNNPCPHICEGGCGIFDDPSRPEVCGKYGCSWVVSSSLPDWMRPDKVGFLMTEYEKYITLTADFNNKVDGSALLYAIEWCKLKKKTLWYTVKSIGLGEYFRGSIMNHPDSVFMHGSVDDIFLPVELHNAVQTN